MNRMMFNIPQNKNKSYRKQFSLVCLCVLFKLSLYVLLWTTTLRVVNILSHFSLSQACMWHILTSQINHNEQTCHRSRAWSKESVSDCGESYLQLSDCWQHCSTALKVVPRGQDTQSPNARLLEDGPAERSRAGVQCTNATQIKHNED